jgi:hypothetical protein
MDQTIVATRSPQEDEFAALLLGEPSVYRGFIDPRRLGDLNEYLWEWNRSPIGEGARLSASWESFIKGVLAQTPGRLLLKSPNHTFRLPWLCNRFPQAQIIWIIRERHAVVDSNRKLWSEMTKRYGLWHCAARPIDEFVEQSLRAHDALVEWARSLLGDRVTFVDFKELTQNTDTVVSRLIHDVGLAPPAARDF